MDASITEKAPVEKRQQTGPTIEQRVRQVVSHEAFLPALAVCIGIILTFWPLIRGLPKLWLGDDGYYSHGFLVPLISGFVVYRWWPRLQKLPAKGSWFALVPLAGLIYITWLAAQTELVLFLSAGLIAAIILATWFVAGLRWALAITLPTMYLFFALPIWTAAIEVYTNPLQIQSTQVAYQILRVLGFDPWQENTTTICLSRFNLDVGVPCSGLKLILALSAFTAFFMLVANLRWWGNLIMVGLVLPLALLVNGLRIALIGIVGEQYGHEAGMAFHDYSGYITLVICFVILFKIARGLGWKD